MDHPTARAPADLVSDLQQHPKSPHCATSCGLQSAWKLSAPPIEDTSAALAPSSMDGCKHVAEQKRPEQVNHPVELRGRDAGALAERGGSEGSRVLDSNSHLNPSHLEASLTDPLFVIGRTPFVSASVRPAASHPASDVQLSTCH